jgi:HlyD family secretion protein
MPSRKIALTLAASILALQPAILFSAEQPAVVSDQPAETNLPAIRVTEASERMIVDRVVVTGTVQAVEEVFVQPQVDGLRIEKLTADIGDIVKAGDVLATLATDSLVLQKSQLLANRAKVEAVTAQLQAQVLEADANAAEAIRQAERAEGLVRSKAVAVGQAEQLRATATAASARVNSAKQAIIANNADLKVIDAQIDDIDLKLARTEVKTTVGGVISVKTAKVGAIAAGAASPLFTLIRDNAIELNADVSEGDLLKLKAGQAVHIKVAGTDTVVEGKVRTIEPIINATTRLGTVKISIDNSDMARIGMYASAEVVISERKVLTLPLTAVTSEAGSMVVRRVVDGIVTLTKVKTGVQEGNYIEVSEGLKANDLVVEKAGAYVRNGDKVSPVFQKTAAN